MPGLNSRIVRVAVIKSVGAENKLSIIHCLTYENVATKSFVHAMVGAGEIDNRPTSLKGALEQAKQWEQKHLEYRGRSLEVVYDVSDYAAKW